jgi:hypothetical protein
LLPSGLNAIHRTVVPLESRMFFGLPPSTLHICIPPSDKPDTTVLPSGEMAIPYNALTAIILQDYVLALSPAIIGAIELTYNLPAFHDTGE